MVRIVAAVLLWMSWGGFWEHAHGATPQPPSSQATAVGTQCAFRDVTVPRPHEQIQQARYTFEERMQAPPGREPYTVVEITERSELDVHDRVWGMFNQAIAQGLPSSSCSSRWIRVDSRMNPQDNGTLSVRFSVRHERWACVFSKIFLARTTATISFAIEPYVTSDSRLAVRSSTPSIQGDLNWFWQLIDRVLLGPLSILFEDFRLLSMLHEIVLDSIDTPSGVEQIETPFEQSQREGRQGMRMRLKEARFVPARDGRIHAELVHSVRARRNTACEFFRNVSNRWPSTGSGGGAKTGGDAESFSEAQRHRHHRTRQLAHSQTHRQPLTSSNDGNAAPDVELSERVATSSPRWKLLQ